MTKMFSILFGAFVDIFIYLFISFKNIKGFYCLFWILTVLILHTLYPIYPATLTITLYICAYTQFFCQTSEVITKLFTIIP